MSESNGHGRCSFIPDGYTRDGFIEGTDFHPDTRFSYRPATNSERAVINGTIRIEHAKGTESGFYQTEKIAADALASHVVSWDITGPDGKEIELNAENALRVEPHLFNRMYQIIMGESITDQEKEIAAEKNS